MEKLLLASQLVIYDVAYDIVEIELYDDNDPYTHKDAQQLQHETFYFHRMNGKGFKEGTYKGLDITFGDGVHHKGYLIRSIRDSLGHIIEGPCLVVDTILKAFRSSKVSDFHARYLQTNPNLCIHCTDSSLFINTSVFNQSALQINSSPRVGLKFKSFQGLETSHVLRFCMSPLRYTIVPGLLRKQSCSVKFKATKKYAGEISAGKRVSPEKLLKSLKSWKVADIARTYGAYQKLIS